jgi:hypothetical protein
VGVLVSEVIKVVFGGHVRWLERVEDGGGWLIHCEPVPAIPPMTASDAAAFSDLSNGKSVALLDWSDDL